jgi:hypothetical protein
MTCKGGPVVKVFFGAGLAHLLFKARLKSELPVSV